LVGAGRAGGVKHLLQIVNYAETLLWRHAAEEKTLPLRQNGERVCYIYFTRPNRFKVPVNSICFCAYSYFIIV